jgi:uncharacterized RDD family membrane protein YckC
MSKTKLVLCLVVLILANGLMFVNILRSGYGDFRGELFMSVITLSLVALIYNGIRWVKWIAGPLFTLLTVSGIVAVIEGDDLSYIAVAFCFAIAAWIVFTTSPREPEATMPKVAPLEEDLVTRETESAPEDPSNYPLLVARIKSTFIDSMLILFVLVIVMMATEDLEHSTIIKVLLGLILGLLYEPVLSVYSATVGQRLTGIRIRKTTDLSRRINLLQSIIRFVVKITLGWISFITIHMNPKRRAIHDFVAGSVMVYKSL